MHGHILFSNVTQKHKHFKRRDESTPVPMHMGSTKSEAVVKKSGVDDGPVLRPLQQIAQVTQMSVTTSNPVPGTVLIQDKHLAWAEPSLHNTNTGMGISSLQAYSRTTTPV